MNATVREMVRAYLDGMGFDGLYRTLNAGASWMT